MSLGLEDYRIPSGLLRASSSYNYNHGPDRARINQPSGHGRVGAWVAKYRNVHQWLQVELVRPAKVTGVATQGRHDAYQWVSKYTVSYSLNGRVFKVYQEYGRSKVGIPLPFLGNDDDDDDDDDDGDNDDRGSYVRVLCVCIKNAFLLLTVYCLLPKAIF